MDEREIVGQKERGGLSGGAGLVERFQLFTDTYGRLSNIGDFALEIGE